MTHFCELKLQDQNAGASASSLTSRSRALAVCAGMPEGGEAGEIRDSLDRSTLCNYSFVATSRSGFALDMGRREGSHQPA